MPQVPTFLRHPEMPAHHTTAIAVCTCVRGPRRMAVPAIAPHSASIGPSPFEARPAEEAGLAPQGVGESESSGGEQPRTLFCYDLDLVARLDAVGGGEAV